jgi:hypothetical protein
MRIILCLLIGITIGLLMPDSVVVNAGDCPECFSDHKPLPGRASANRPATIDGRRAISVKIDSSWNNPGTTQTNTLVQNAVNGALSGWNTAGAGQSNAYYFDQRPTDTAPQITIVRGGTSACATTTGNAGGPYTIHLPEDTDQRSLDALLQIIEHEIGHVYGLDHANKEDCPGNQSIMRVNSGKWVNGTGADAGRQVWDSCGGTDRAITANDVQKAAATNTPAGPNTPGGPPAVTCKKTEVEPQPVHNDPPGGYVEPNYYYYPTTCYYYYDAVDYYHYCECAQSGCQCSSGDYRGLMYVGTEYYLTDYFCF